MKTILSVFDFSGNWPSYFFENGWDVVMWDIKDGKDVNEFDSVETTLELLGNVHGILAALPCTHTANSGSQYWGIKDSDGRTFEAIQLINQVDRLVNLFEPSDPDYDEGFFWVVENPVGRLSKLAPHWGSPFYFDPCDFGGYLDISDSDHNELDRIRRKDGIDINKEEIDFVLDKNAYTKKTGLWGEFKHPKKKCIEPVRLCKQGTFTQIYGGKSENTKQKRSVTPLGFSKAFYEAQVSPFYEQLEIPLF